MQLLRHSRFGAEQGVGRADGFERAAIGSQRCGLDGLWEEFPGEPLTAHSSRPLSTWQFRFVEVAVAYAKYLVDEESLGREEECFLLKFMYQLLRDALLIE